MVKITVIKKKPPMGLSLWSDAEVIDILISEEWSLCMQDIRDTHKKGHAVGNAWLKKRDREAKTEAE